VGSQLGRYEVLKHLAKGGMADVLLARASGLGGFERHFVIKRIREELAQDPKFVEMFVSEARLAGALHHHNIVQVQDIGQQDGRYYFAMEYVHGEDLRAILSRLHERDQQMPVQHIVTIAASVAAALHHAHEQVGPDRKPLNIVHRDVTPANILISYDGNVKVVDFGIAKAGITRLETAGGAMKGSVPYLAPEQCTGKTVDRRSDVFALGIVLYELATVRRLFKADTEFLTMSAIVQARVPRPMLLRKDLPADLERIILKALAREPAARFQTAEELRLALDKLATKERLTSSANALAAYMKKLFGDRLEPWVAGAEHAVREQNVDFDGSVCGLALPPPEAVEGAAIPPAYEAGNSSPIAAARRAATGTPVKPAGTTARSEQGMKFVPPAQMSAVKGRARSPSKPAPHGVPVLESALDEKTTVDPKPPVPLKSALPPPPAKPKPAAPITPANMGDTTLVEGTIDHGATDPDIMMTKVANPPPPPVIVASTLLARESDTAIVTPLPSEGVKAKRADKNDSTTLTTTTTGMKRTLLVGGAAGVVILGITLFVFARASETTAAAPSVPAPAAVEAPPPPQAPAPAPAPAAAPSDPSPVRTVRNSEAATPTTDPPPPAPEPAPVAAAPEPAKPEAKPEPPPEQEKPPEAVTKPAPTKPAAKPATKPIKAPTKVVAKPAKPKPPLTYDPDALFLSKKKK
jgi:tRNA A-37 threonylcarbamoyl transferase component Bud32